MKLQQMMLTFVFLATLMASVMILSDMAGSIVWITDGGVCHCILDEDE